MDFFKAVSACSSQNSVYWRLVEKEEVLEINVADNSNVVIQISSRAIVLFFTRTFDVFAASWYH